MSIKEFLYKKRGLGDPVMIVFAIILPLLLLLVVLFPPSPGPVESRKATCQSNLVCLGKAYRMYAGDWDGKLPTNRWNGANGRFLSKACRISDEDYQGKNPQYGANYIEALSPYIKMLEDTRLPKKVWMCPTTSKNKRTYPARWGSRAAMTTYCMNWYVAERDESEFKERGMLLLFREMDRRTHALLRPYPSFPPDAKHPRGWGPPLHAFPEPNEFGTKDVDPARHGEGSLMLMADGHVTYYLANQLVARPVLTGWRGGKKKRWMVPGVDIMISP